MAELVAEIMLQMRGMYPGHYPDIAWANMVVTWQQRLSLFAPEVLRSVPAEIGHTRLLDFPSLDEVVAVCTALQDAPTDLPAGNPYLELANKWERENAAGNSKGTRARSQEIRKLFDDNPIGEEIA